jgi:hypothetical protein
MRPQKQAMGGGKTVPLSARISPLAKALIAAERLATGESEGEVVDRCVVQLLVRTPAGRKLAREYVRKAPAMSAIFDALLSPTVGEQTDEPRKK